MSFIRGWFLAGVLLSASTCAPGPALKAAVRNSASLAGARELTVVGFDDDAFALAQLLRQKGFTVATAKERTLAKSDYVLDISGCCPTALGYNFCSSPLSVDLHFIPQGQLVFQAAIDDTSDCPKRFYAAVADEVATRWKP
jgi:hypothetical protein